RSQRLASDAQFLALAARDGGCRMPGCPIPPQWCQVDHIQEWDAQNGPTDVDLLVLWCIFHHHYRHRPDVTLHGNANNLSITLPDGRTVPLPARGPTSHTHAA
ncbi:MAG TPA: HNH endonuclease signature motif containing protein, partial [Ilumatobacteraceae bacterium]